ncbi:MAG TPA: DegT/DnrJ/EryC1/StrS family aminotransferase [Nitrososphaerales archaeon]|nr:DegT/DnrJ/EryC1/StrS family aminotransferase [Nitrososphaerales archaeon]
MAGGTEKIRIPVCAPLLTGREIDYLKECLQSTWISSGGPLVSRFEEGFARFCESGYGVTTNSGTTALHLALAAARIGPGDEVILPTFTMIACINAVEYTGAKGVLVDSDPATWTLDASKVKSKVGKRTKAIMPVHIYGHPADMDPLVDLAKKRGLFLLEDAAEAHGALYKGAKVGSLGDAASFSFYSNKIITTGEGGMNVTKDKALAERMAWLRAHAFGRGGKHFWHEELGFGYRMSSLQAAVGLAQLERIDEMVGRRVAHAKLYNEQLDGVEGVELPPEKDWAKSVFWMYSIRVPSQQVRDGLMRWLAARGVETRTFFYPVHRQPYYAARYKGERFPVADKLSATGINLPSGNGLTEEEISEVCDGIRAFFERR